MPVEQNGPVTTGTKENLVSGLRSKPMSDSAVDAAMQHAAAFVERLVEIYSTDVAVGEVGQGGSGRATDEPILAERPPRALLYGRVQSGKTVAMILTSALCLDNGFRVIVVLTTDNVALVRQTSERFKSLDGPRVFSATRENTSYEWEGQEEQLRRFVGEEGLVLVCAKNAFNLPRVIHFLQQLDASEHPVLFLDDEADAATPDTTLSARSAAKPSAPAFASTIHRLVIENEKPDEAGFSLGEKLPHSMYVQVTATPHVLLLQKADARVRPTTTFLLPPGEGYCGGEVFFGELNRTPGGPQPPTIVIVDDNEAAMMRRQVPAGLAKSLDFFILSACARGMMDRWPPKGFKHLSHTSRLIDQHEEVSAHIDTHLNTIREIIRNDDVATRTYFSVAFSELRRSVPGSPSLDELLVVAARELRQVEVVRVNSKAEIPAYGPRLNFIIGGNILGRGLTIDDLLVTYYIREAKISQMDTIWQHARMYGYRRSFLEHMRIYIPHRLGLMFKELHESEELLRQLLGAEDVDAVLIRVPRAARPTRPNALAEGAVRTLEAGRDQIFPLYLQLDSTAAAGVLDVLKANGVPIGSTERDARSTPVPFMVACTVVESLALREDDPGLWQTDYVLALLQSFAGRFGAGCRVYVRGIEGSPPPEGWTRGRLSGPEIAIIRASAAGAPALALMFLGDTTAPKAWYPTLVMPAGTPAYVFTSS